MGFLDIKSEGLDEMQAAVKKLEKLGAVVAGIEFLGDTRGSTNNAEIIAFHRDGIETKRGTIVRDITASDSDIQEAVKAFMDEASDFLDGDDLSPEDQAAITRAATKTVAKALKKAAEKVRKPMQKRVNNGKDKDGNALEPVTAETAAQRMSKSGVPSSSVMKDTGDLLSNLSRKSYRFNKRK